MQSSFIRTVSRILVICFTAASFQAQAGLIGTGDTAGSAIDSRAARSLLVDRLLAYGVAGDSARERVSSLSDAEAMKFAGEVENAPAGGEVVFGIIAVIVFLIWRFGYSDQAKAEAAAQERAQQPRK